MLDLNFPGDTFQVFKAVVITIFGSTSKRTSTETHHNHESFYGPSLKPRLTTHHLKISVQWRWVTKLSTSTLKKTLRPIEETKLY